MAGTVDIVFSKISRPYANTYPISKVVISWTGDSADGSVPQTDIDITNLIGRYCCLGVTDPGSTAPTDNYDIEILDEYGVDIFGGSLKTRDTANSEQVLPVIGTAMAPRLCADTWTFKLTNNSVNSATGKCVLFFEN